MPEPLCGDKGEESWTGDWVACVFERFALRCAGLVTLELVVCLRALLEPELVEIFKLLSSIGGVGIPLSIFGDPNWVDFKIVKVLAG